jgi:predicted metal-dependent peptidase
VQSAADTAKAYGKMPGALKRFADQVLDPQISWQELLRTTVVVAASRDTKSWARPHRRRLAGQGVYLARPTAFGCETLVVAVDTSGSIGRKELSMFFAELSDIIRTCSPERIWLLGADSAVASVEELPGDVDIQDNPPRVGGGGGTDFNPVFHWVEKQGLIPDCLVYFTDLCGPGPTIEPGYPVVWCSTTEGSQGAVGKTIHIKL